MPATYKLQLSLVPMNHQTSPPPSTCATPLTLKELLPCHKCRGFCYTSLCDGPGPATIEYQGIPVPQEHISRDLTRNQDNGIRRKAEILQPNHSKLQSSETIPFQVGGSTGIDPGHARTRAIDKKGGGGKVCKSPSNNPSIFDRSLT